MMHRTPGLGFMVAAGLALVALTAPACGGPPTTRIRLDAGTRYQTIDGWATSSRYWEEDKANDRFDASFEPYTDAVARFLVDEVGINAVRLELGSGTENPVAYWRQFRSGAIGYREYAKHRYEKINDNADPDVANLAGYQFDLFDFRVRTSVLPLARALARRGERLRVNVCYVDFQGNNAAGSTIQGTLSHADAPREYAELIQVALRRLQDEHALSADSVEIILEPDNTARWTGRSIGEAMIATAERLSADGLHPEFLAPSTMTMGHALEYLDDLLTVPGVSRHLGTVVYHRYRLQRTTYAEQIRSRAAAHGFKTAMLERLRGDIDTLLEDLTVAHVSAWQQWGPATRLDRGDDGGAYALVDLHSPAAAPRIVRSSRSEQLANVFRYVRRGAVRIGSTTSAIGQPSVAFVNPDGTWVVVARTASRTTSVAVDGLPPGSYHVVFTPDGGAHGSPRAAAVPDTGVFEAPVAGRGVLTVYGDSAGLPEGEDAPVAPSGGAAPEADAPGGASRPGVR